VAGRAGSGLYQASDAIGQCGDPFGKHGTSFFTRNGRTPGRPSQETGIVLLGDRFLASNAWHFANALVLARIFHPLKRRLIMLSLFNRLWNKLAKPATRSGLGRSASRSNPARLGLEILEDRQMPSITLVNGTLTLQPSTAAELKANDTITISYSAGMVTASITPTSGAGEKKMFSVGSVEQIQLEGRSSPNKFTDTFKILGTPSGVQTTLYTGPNSIVNVLANTGDVGVVGSGPLTVNLGNLFTDVQGIVGGVFVGNPNSTTTVTVDDQADPSGHVVTVSNQPFFGVPFTFIQGLAPGEIGIENAGTKQVNIMTGTYSGNTHDVVLNSTAVPITLDVNGGQTNVELGMPGGFGFDSVQNIDAPVTINNRNGGSSNIYIDDSSDPTGTKNATLNKSSFPGYGVLTGLAPATITYEYAGTNQLVIGTNPTSTVNVLSDGGLHNTYVDGVRK